MNDLILTDLTAVKDAVDAGRWNVRATYMVNTRAAQRLLGQPTIGDLAVAALDRQASEWKSAAGRTP